jgi:hypothetical protein
LGKDHAQKKLKRDDDSKPFRFKEAPLRPENHLFQCGRNNLDVHCWPVASLNTALRDVRNLGKPEVAGARSKRRV